MHIDHIGYLVQDIERAIKDFIDEGYEIDYPKYKDEYFDQTVIFIKNGSLRIELISPNSEKAAAAPVLKKRGAGPYHICYQTDSFDEDFQLFRNKRYIPTMEPVIAQTGPLAGKKLAFLMRRDIGIVELVGN